MKTLFFCTNSKCAARDKVVKVFGHLKPCDRILCKECGQQMEEMDWRDQVSEPFRSRGVYA